jgi:hypothetical protein
VYDEGLSGEGDGRYFYNFGTGRREFMNLEQWRKLKATDFLRGFGEVEDAVQKGGLLAGFGGDVIS